MNMNVVDFSACRAVETFQQQQMDAVAAVAYKRGQESMEKMRRKRDDRMIGLGFIFGAAFASVVWATVLGFFA